MVPFRHCKRNEFAPAQCKTIVICSRYERKEINSLSISHRANGQFLSVDCTASKCAIFCNITATNSYFKTTIHVWIVFPTKFFKFYPACAEKWLE